MCIDCTTQRGEVRVCMNLNICLGIVSGSAVVSNSFPGSDSTAIIVKVRVKLTEICKFYLNRLVL